MAAPNTEASRQRQESLEALRRLMLNEWYSGWGSIGATDPLARTDPVTGTADLPDEDEVNRPAHYTSGGIETLDFLRAKLSDEEYRGFLLGNVIKYLTRAGKKTPDHGVDYRKAQFYLNRLVEHTTGKPGTQE